MRGAVLGAIAAVPGGNGSGGFDGTKGFTDFSEIANADLNVAPANWTSRMAAKDPSTGAELFRKVIKASAVGGRLFVVDTTSDGFSGSFKGVETWDVPGVLGTTWEILMLLRAGTHSVGPAWSRNDAPSSGLYTPPTMGGIQVTALLTNAQHRPLAKSAGDTSFGAGTLTNTGVSFGNSARIYIRLRRDGKRYRAKVWAQGSSEPGSYQHDTTESLFPDDSGYIGFLLSNYTGQTSHVIRVEYLSVTTNPAAAPAPSPPGTDSVIGGNFGFVDFTTATVDSTHFVHYPLTGSNGVTLTLESRGGSKQGTVLKVACPSGSHRGFINWIPGGYLADGDTLALIELDGSAAPTLAGPGVGDPRTIQGSVWSQASRSYSMIRHASDRIDWGRHKSKNTEDAWPIGLNTGSSTGAIAPGERWWVRQRKDGNRIQVRAWKEGTSEPGTWYIDSSSQLEWDVVGYPGLGYDTGGANTFYVEHLAWTDDPVTNPINPV